MAVNLIIDGQQFELAGAATEETLHRLLEKMDKSSGSSMDTAKVAAGNITKMANSAGTLNMELKGLAKGADDFADELDNAADAAGGFASKAGGFIKKLFSAGEGVVNFGSSTAGVGFSLDQMGKSADSLAKEIPLIGSFLGAAGGAMIGHAANLQDTFRGLSGTGAMFTDSFFQLERVAANSYISLADMTSIIRSNSEALAVFGGSTKLGAKRFAEMNMVMANTYRNELRNFGYGATEAAEMLAVFTAANARNSNFSTLSVREQAAAGANFAKEMTLMAALTGQDRKQLAEKLAADKRRSDVELKLSRMGSEAQTRARAAFGALEKEFGAQSPVLEAFRAKFLGQGVVIGNPAANMLLAGAEPMGLAINDVASRLREGNISLGDVFKRLRESAQGQIDNNRNLEALAPFSEFAGTMTDISAGSLGLAKQHQKVVEEFGGDYEKFFKAQRTNLDGASKAIITASNTAEDIGKNTRLLFNSLTEKTVSGIASGVKALSDALGSMDTETASTLKSSFAAASGGATHFANMATKAADKLADIAKLAKAGGGSTIGNLAKGAASSTAGAASSVLKKIPILGSLFAGGVTAADSLNQGESVSRAATKGVGSAGGSFAGGMAGAAAGAKLGALIGTAGGPVGLALGGIIGGLLGGIGGAFLGEKAGTAGGEMVSDAAGFAEGGIVRQPTLSMIGEGQSDEAVIPLQNNRTVPVSMDMSAIDKLASKVERLADAASQGYDPTMANEMKKFNRNAEKMVKLLS